jgi:hypothetical protein
VSPEAHRRYARRLQDRAAIARHAVGRDCNVPASASRTPTWSDCGDLRYRVQPTGAGGRLSDYSNAAAAHTLPSTVEGPQATTRFTSHERRPAIPRGVLNARVGSARRIVSLNRCVARGEQRRRRRCGERELQRGQPTREPAARLSGGGGPNVLVVEQAARGSTAPPRVARSTRCPARRFRPASSTKGTHAVGNSRVAVPGGGVGVLRSLEFLPVAAARVARRCPDAEPASARGRALTVRRKPERPTRFLPLRRATPPSANLSGRRSRSAALDTLARMANDVNVIRSPSSAARCADDQLLRRAACDGSRGCGMQGDGARC